MIKKINVDYVKEGWLIYNIATKLQPNFTLTKNNRLFISLLIHYFTGSNRFSQMKAEYNEEMGQKVSYGDLNKGLYIVGCVGSGKSHIFRVFKEYTQLKRINGFKVFDYSQILDDFEASDNLGGKKKIGFDSLNKFGVQFENRPDGVKDVSNSVYIDDFAVRTYSAKSFGTEINIVDELIAIRHKVYERSNRLTHISTNVYPGAFINEMDERNKSRFVQMFNVLEFNDNDWRLKK